MNAWGVGAEKIETDVCRGDVGAEKHDVGQNRSVEWGCRSEESVQ